MRQYWTGKMLIHFMASDMGQLMQSLQHSVLKGFCHSGVLKLNAPWLVVLEHNLNCSFKKTQRLFLFLKRPW